MVRQKKGFDASKQAKLQEMVENFKIKFKNDKKELEEAKRNFSTALVNNVVKELEAAFPENVLNMKASEFVYLVQKFGEEDKMANSNLHTPQQNRKKFKSITTPSGVNIKIPAMITPRVDGAVLRSRTSRHGEILFSVNGTPVTFGMEPVDTSAEQVKALQDLMQQKESEMSPATLRIMQQLKAVLAKRPLTPAHVNDENMTHASETSDDN